MTVKELFKIIWFPVFASLLCCVSPILIAVLGIGSVSLAYSYSDVLYGQYKWVFRIAGLVLLAIALWSYFRKAKNICTLDQAKRRKNEIINASLIAVIMFVIGYFLLYQFLNGLALVLQKL